jgi:phosphohistidine phosphatase
MKTLILIRHAKSSWDNPMLKDFERPLNDRGKEDAPKMAQRLKNKNIDIDFLVSSPAKRAKKTAKIFLKEFGIEDEKLVLNPSLYEASLNDFYTVLEEVNNKNKAVALFSHNPGITDFINSLDCSPVYNMPTCGVFALEIDTDSWDKFRHAAKRFLFFDYPKKEN